MWWKLFRWIITISIRHYALVCIISSDEDWRTWKRCTKSRVSASSWLPWSIDPAHMSMIPINNPINHGWKEEDGKLLPIWTTLSFAKDVFHLNVKCICPIACSQCKRVKTKLKCTLHIRSSAYAHARSRWTRTISNTDMNNFELHCSRICFQQ